MRGGFDSSCIHLAWSTYILCDTTSCSYRNLPLDDFGQHACYTLSIHLEQDLFRCPTCVESHLMDCWVRVRIVTYPGRMKTSHMPYQTKMADLFRIPLIAEACVYWYEKTPWPREILQDKDFSIFLKSRLSFIASTMLSSYRLKIF